MKPVSLKVKGLNSFVEAQTIEFSKLTEKGLFGIFGPTGSGKSTILDGITIALYGKVSRDTKEFVNTDTNVVEISYDFEIGVGKTRKLYRAERSIKRLKTGNFKTSSSRAILKNNSIISVEGSRPPFSFIKKSLNISSMDFSFRLSFEASSLSSPSNIGSMETISRLRLFISFICSVLIISFVFISRYTQMFLSLSSLHFSKASSTLSHFHISIGL